MNPSNQPNLKCPECEYEATSNCFGIPFGYCAPAVCKVCNSIYDVNTEFCGDPKEINACEHCGGHDYEMWDEEKRGCPKCGGRMLSNYS